MLPSRRFRALVGDGVERYHVFFFPVGGAGGHGAPKGVTAMQMWTTARSAELYRTEMWGAGYFTISNRGHLLVHPDRKPEQGIDLYELVQTLVKRGIEVPLLLRFDGIIRDRIRYIQDAFDTAIREFEYEKLMTLIAPEEQRL